MLYDAHLHVGLFCDPQKLCQVARDFNIMPVSCSVSIEDSLKNSVLSSLFGFPSFAGIHPCFIKEKDGEFPRLRHLVAASNFKGIGECGLDGVCDIDLETQKQLLKSQLELAVELGLPVSLHIRKCHGELLRLLKPLKGKISGIVHNFTFSPELAEAYLQQGLCLSVGRYLLKPSAKLLTSLRLAGPDRILIESDADFADGIDYDPERLIACYESLSKCFGLSFGSMEQCLEQNAFKFLGLSDDLRLRC